MSQPVAAPVSLREAAVDDLPILFEQQRDPEANEMAAFTVANPDDREAYLARWTRLLDEAGIHIMTILYGDEIAGSVLSYEEDDRTEVSYWLGRDFWGRGIATHALAQFLLQQRSRPLFARVAQDNFGSIRVLEKCGFVVIDRETSFANARGEEIVELIMRLDDDRDTL